MGGRDAAHNTIKHIFFALNEPPLSQYKVGVPAKTQFLWGGSRGPRKNAVFVGWYTASGSVRPIHANFPRSYSAVKFTWSAKNKNQREKEEIMGGRDAAHNTIKHIFFALNEPPLSQYKVGVPAKTQFLWGGSRGPRKNAVFVGWYTASGSVRPIHANFPRSYSAVKFTWSAEFQQVFYTRRSKTEHFCSVLLLNVYYKNSALNEPSACRIQYGLRSCSSLADTFPSLPLRGEGGPTESVDEV